MKYSDCGFVIDFKKIIREKIDQLMYVLRVARKPEREEIIENFKVVIAGIFVIGLLGFLMHIIFTMMVK